MSLLLAAVYDDLGPDQVLSVAVTNRYLLLVSRHLTLSHVVTRVCVWLQKKHACGFKCRTFSACKHLWKCAIEQQYFFTSVAFSLPTRAIIIMVRLDTTFTSG